MLWGKTEVSSRAPNSFLESFFSLRVSEGGGIGEGVGEGLFREPSKRWHWGFEIGIT